MIRTTLASIFLGALVLSFSPTPALAQALPSKQEAADWVAKAIEESRFTAPGTPPFHLVAKIHFTMSDQTLDGNFEILWAAPDRYRLELRMGNIGETDVILGDKRYVSRNTPTMTLAMASVEAIFLIGLIPQSPGSAEFRVAKVSSVERGGHRETCAVVLPLEYCFDANTAVLVGIRTLPKAGVPVADMAISIESSDYQNLGSTRLARSISRKLGLERIDAKVEKWETVDTFGDNVFVPLSTGTVWDWCSAPAVRQPQHPPPQYPDLDVHGSTITYRRLVLYKIVAADGETKQVTRLAGPTDDITRQFVDAEKSNRSPVHICNGKPVEYETVLRFGMIPITKP